MLRKSDRLQVFKMRGKKKKNPSLFSNPPSYSSVPPFPALKSVINVEDVCRTRNTCFNFLDENIELFSKLAPHNLLTGKRMEH